MDIDGRRRDGDKSTANAHCGGRRIDLHMAGLGDLGGDETHRALDQVDQCGIRCAVRVVDELVEHHSRVLLKTERASVRKPDPERRITACLDNVALEHQVAYVQVDGDAIAHRGRRTADRLDPPDWLLRSRPRCLSVLSVLTRCTRTGKKFDQARGKQGAFRRNEVWLLFVPEIIGDEDLVAGLPGQNEVRSFTLEIGREQQVRVGDGDGAGVRLHGNRRHAFARVEGLTPRVNHDLTFQVVHRNPARGGTLLPQTHSPPTTSLSISKALWCLGGAYYAYAKSTTALLFLVVLDI